MWYNWFNHCHTQTFPTTFFTDTTFHIQFCHTPCTTPSFSCTFFTHHLSPYLVSRCILCHTLSFSIPSIYNILSHTIFDPPLCHTPLITTPFLTNRSNALHRTLSPRTPMLHGMSTMLSFSSLHGCYLLCTPASAVKVLKTQIPEARQGSNLFLPPVYLILLKTILKITKNTTALVGKKWPSRPARHCQ